MLSRYQIDYLRIIQSSITFIYLNALINDGGKLKAIGDLTLETLIPREPKQMQGMDLHTLISKSGINVVGHTGDAFGYQAAAFAVPDSDTVFVVHVNCDCAALTASLISNAYKTIVSSRIDGPKN